MRLARIKIQKYLFDGFKTVDKKWAKILNKKKG